MQPYYEDETLRLYRAVCGRYNNNAYVLVCCQTAESVIIDTPEEPEKVLAAAQGTRVRAILITHRHADHLAGFGAIKTATGAPAAIGRADAEAMPTPPDFYLNDGDLVPFGRLALKVVHTPGHTPGATCLLLGNALFSGDTLFPGGPGHTRTPEALQESIRSITTKLLVLPDATVVYPGHGDTTTIGRAREEYRVFAGRPHPPDLCGDVLWLKG
ncbi:MAG: MBL fold metallo-hydrolase [Chloroflexi bacterium]|nr:MBL fold metallo-hydrolase [Chloroflexota bacterium]